MVRKHINKSTFRKGFWQVLKQEISVTLEIRAMPQMVARALCEGEKPPDNCNCFPGAFNPPHSLNQFSPISATLWGRTHGQEYSSNTEQTLCFVCVWFLFCFGFCLIGYLFLFVWLVVFCCGCFCLLYFLVCFDFHFFFREIKNMTLGVEGGERSGRSCVWGRIGSKCMKSFNEKKIKQINFKKYHIPCICPE